MEYVNVSTPDVKKNVKERTAHLTTDLKNVVISGDNL